jgi:hypothetical protein
MLYWLDPARHMMPYVYTKDPKQLFSCRLCNDGASYFFNKRHAHLEIRHKKEVTTESELKFYFEALPTTRPFDLKPFPYIAPIAEWWLREPIMLVEKSRDMMATWTVVAMYTWDTLFHENRENMFQSEDATKTADLVKRADFIYKSQPKFLRKHKAVFSTGSSRAGILQVAGVNSLILGMPQGADQIRQYHPSGCFVDEAAFQMKAGESFMAIKPAIQAGGRYTAVSSANPGFFMAACRDTLEMVVGVG